jgi:hypothetical protein
MKKRKFKNKVRMFRGLSVQEARAAMHVQPNQKDISGATLEDPSNCAYARCIKRTLNAESVFVFKTVAYIQTLNESGAPIMERYLVRKYARDYLIRFDGGQKVEAGGFVFHAPQRSQTLTYKHRQQLKRIKAGKKSPRISEGVKPRIKSFSLRRGTGKVHLFGGEDQIRPAKISATA